MTPIVDEGIAVKFTDWQPCTTPPVHYGVYQIRDPKLPKRTYWMAYKDGSWLSGIVANDNFTGAKTNSPSNARAYRGYAYQDYESEEWEWRGMERFLSAGEMSDEELSKLRLEHKVFRAILDGMKFNYNDVLTRQNPESYGKVVGMEIRRITDEMVEKEKERRIAGQGN